MTADEIKKPETSLIASAARFGARRVQGDLLQTTITPRQILNYLLAAEAGDISAQAELFEKMEEKDGELDAHLRTRKAGVASHSFEIQPADDSAPASRAAEYARQVVADIPAVRDAIFDLLDAIPKGFSVLEIEWRTSAREWRPVRLHYRPQRWFHIAEDGESLRLRDTATPEGVPLNPLNFIVHSVRARSGFRARTSLLRSCVRAFVVRHFAWKDWMGFAEVYGMPMRIGRLREGVPWDSDEAKQLEAALAAMGMDMYAMLREGNTIEVLDAKNRAGEGTLFEHILDRAAHEMTLAILGQTLTSSAEKVGSYALGKVHNQVRWDLIESDALALDETLTNQLLRPIVALNFGEDAPVPRWHMQVEQPEDLESLSATVKTLTEAGLRVPARWAYAKFGIPQPAPDEEVLQPPGRAPMFSIAPSSARGNESAMTDSPLFRFHARLHHMTPEAFRVWLNQPVPPLALDKIAIAFLREKRVVPDSIWERLSPAGKQRAWHITGLTEQPTALVAHELIEAAARGESENAFLTRIEDLGLAVPEGVEPAPGQIPSWQARIVDRTNRWSAQNGARYIQLQRDRDVRPFGEWIVHTPCPICEPLAGHVAPLDGEFFSKYWPPIHHQCQCEVVSLSAEEVEEEGLEEKLRGPDPEPLDAPPDFIFHPGDAYYLESEGGEPATEVGRADRAILAAAKLVTAFL
jgi:phage gp29-like protein